jgi:NAD(P)-dependent dehydrogenase (short-subunit alcohol dehydrogenase family)
MYSIRSRKNNIDMKGLNGKRVFISGGCGDIGRAVAARFLEEGARVVVADLSTSKKSEAITPQAASERLHYIACDVTQRESVQVSVQAAEEWLGGIDVAISNAGVVTNQPFLEVTEEAWRRTLEVNLTGSFFIAQAAIKAILRNPKIEHRGRGSILFTGSWVQQMPWPEGASYCSSKGGQEMLMKVIAQEMAPHGITCNMVAPGMVYAGLTRIIYDQDPQFRDRADATIPLGRMSTVEEVAGAFVFLASAEGAYITGTSILVDGGATLVRRN